MRRSLGLAALVLLLLGVEVGAGTVSLTADRLFTGAAAVATGREWVLPAARVALGWLLVAAAVALLGANAWAERAADGVRGGGTACPRCGKGTRRIPRRGRHRVLAQLLEEGFTNRACGQCGWTGLAARS